MLRSTDGRKDSRRIAHNCCDALYADRSLHRARDDRLLRPSRVRCASVCCAHISRNRCVAASGLALLHEASASVAKGRASTVLMLGCSRLKTAISNSDGAAYKPPLEGAEHGTEQNRRVGGQRLRCRHHSRCHSRFGNVACYCRGPAPSSRLGLGPADTLDSPCHRRRCAARARNRPRPISLGGSSATENAMTANDRLQRLADAWHNGLSPGDGMGLLWHLALRHYPSAMTELGRRIGEDGLSAADSFSAAGLGYRALRLGDPLAAYNLAMSCFNRRDLRGYRYWLRLAANAGDEDARQQLRRFETRLPHGAARDINRSRPRRPYD